MLNRRQADSLSNRNTSNTVGLEYEEEDEDVLDPSQSQDSREPDTRVKKYMLEDDDGNEYGDDSLLDQHYNPHRYPDTEGTSREKYRGPLAAQHNKQQGVNNMSTKKDILSVEDIKNKYGVRYAQHMIEKGISHVDRKIFEMSWNELQSKRKAAYEGYTMSDHYQIEKDSNGDPLVDYYDSWDIDWRLHKAKNFNEKGSKLGEYRTANKAREAAQLEHGDGNYVIEGISCKDGSHWGYYVVSIKNGKTTRYSKKPVIVHETHINTYRKASLQNKLIQIPEEEFLADSVTAGRYVRARLTKRAASAIKGMAKAAQRMMDNVEIGSKQFPEKEDRGTMLDLMKSIDSCLDKLRGMVDAISPEDKEKLHEVVETLEEVSGDRGGLGEGGGEQEMSKPPVDMLHKGEEGNSSSQSMMY
jgi:hypothetical protein